MRMFHFVTAVSFFLLLSILLFIGQSNIAQGACDFLRFRLPEEIAEPNSIAERMDRDIALYQIRGLLRDDTADIVLLPDIWQIPCRGLESDVAAFERLRQAGEELDVRQVAEIFNSSYFASMPRRSQAQWIGDSVSALLRSTRFRDWPHDVVPLSLVKRKTRRIYRSPTGFSPPMAVSETLDSATGDQTAPILEIEVAIKRRSSRDWDFYSFDKEGVRATYSTFPAGKRSSPDICIACHYSPADGSVSRFMGR